MKEPPEVSLVVPAYNEERYLPDCLDAIAEAVRAAGASAEVIVADDGSTDRTAELAHAGGARVVPSGARNIAAARNAGACAARGRFLVFVDADTCINGPLLSATLGALRSGTFCGGGAAVRVDRTDWRTELAFRAWNAFSGILCWAAGSFLFVRADAFRACGGFDRRLYASEEVDLSMRLARWGRPRGMRFRILPERYVTSSRKWDEISPLKMMSLIARLGLRRERLRSRAECAIWYDVRR